MRIVISFALAFFVFAVGSLAFGASQTVMADLVCIRTYGAAQMEVGVFENQFGRLKAQVFMRKLSGPASRVPYGEYDVTEITRGTVRTFQDRSGRFYLRFERSIEAPLAAPEVSLRLDHPQGLFTMGHLQCRKNVEFDVEPCEDYLNP